MHLFSNADMDKCVVVRLKGGLGNQMFQYAFGKAMALETNSNLWIDISFLRQNNQTKGVFIARDYGLWVFPNINDKVLEFEKLYENRLLKKLKRRIFYPKLQEVVEATLTYNGAYSNLQPPVLYDGFWQNENYFLKYENEIRKCFSFSPVEEGDNAYNYLNWILKAPVSIGVHVRRGDYLNDLILQHHGICSKAYYLEAFRQMRERYPGAEYFFFSDDPAWVDSEMAKYVENYTVVEGNLGADSWKDMCLMSRCSHQIIANSSFSWWAAWLNNDKNKSVIAPSRWLANNELNAQAKAVCPPAWIRIESH